MKARLAHIPLGRIEYNAALAVQRAAHERRVGGEIPDLVLTAEHDPVFTVGRGGSLRDLLASPEALHRESIPVHRAERGGGITYHGPGQVVAYPILHLKERGLDLHRYIHLLEEAALRVAGGLGIAAQRRDGHPGVWVGARKLASIGVHVRRWVTRHGVALNVAVRREHFAMIRPCGEAVEVISLCDLVDPAPTMRDVEDALLSHLGDLLGMARMEGDRTWLTPTSP
jgi:lipoate-protein ligase B